VIPTQEAAKNRIVVQRIMPSPGIVIEGIPPIVRRFVTMSTSLGAIGAS
jgi:hypothetical protein